MKVEVAAERARAIGDEHASVDPTGEALGSQALARHIGVDYHELRGHAQDQANRLARAVLHGAKVTSVIRLTYMAGFFAGAIWKDGEES
jgi:hypothetical protein